MDRVTNPGAAAAKKASGALSPDDRGTKPAAKDPEPRKAPVVVVRVSRLGTRTRVYPAR
jgi:hypothetical protein